MSAVLVRLRSRFGCGPRCFVQPFSFSPPWLCILVAGRIGCLRPLVTWEILVLPNAFLIRVSGPANFVASGTVTCVLLQVCVTHASGTVYVDEFLGTACQSCRGRLVTLVRGWNVAVMLFRLQVGLTQVRETVYVDKFLGAVSQSGRRRSVALQGRALQRTGQRL